MNTEPNLKNSSECRSVYASSEVVDQHINFESSLYVEGEFRDDPSQYSIQDSVYQFESQRYQMRDLESIFFSKSDP